MTWRMVKGYEGKYWLSPDGEVKNSRGLILKPIDLGHDMKVVELYGNGLRTRKLITELLAENYPEYSKED